MSTLKLVSFIPTWNSDIEISQALSASSTTFSASLSSSFSPSFSSFSSSSAASATAVSEEFPFSVDYYEHGHPSCAYRRADKLLSWANRDLLESLKGKQQSRLAHTHTHTFIYIICMHIYTHRGIHTHTHTHTHT